MRRSWITAALAVVLGMATAIFAQQAKPLEEGQKVEVREGDTWSAATIVKKEGRRYQIRYEGGTEEEWVTADRIRAAGAVGAPAPAPATAPGVKPAEKAAPKLVEWKNGQNVEVKWGGLWFPSSIINRRGEWYLIEYTREKRREWVEHWRIRKQGDTEDAIGYARPNPVWRAGDNPPREKAGDPPLPTGARVKTQEEKQTEEVFRNDPAFKDADWGGAKELQLDVAPAAGKLAVDAAKPAANARPVRLAGATKEFFDSVKDVVIGRGGGPGSVAVVLHENAPPGMAAPQVRLERIDLAGGKSLGVTELKEKMVMLDASSDGKLVAMRNDEFGFGKSTRLEIVALDGAAMKRVLILYPYEKESWQPDKDVTAAWIIDGGHVLTTNPKGKMALWDIATGKAIYKIAGSGYARPGFSAGGKLMAVEAKGVVAIVEPLSGNVIGSLPLESRSGMSYSFSPSGQQLAGWNSSGTVLVWDLNTGKLYREFTVVGGGRNMEIVSDGYGLVDGRLLIDFERRIPLWNYQGAGRTAAAVAPSGMLWYTVKPADGTGSLNPMKVPTPEALALAKTLNADDLLLLRPGVKVALSMNVDFAEPDREQVMAALKNQIAQNQLVLDDAAPIRITASTEQGKTTETEYRPIGAGPRAPAQKVSVTPTITKLTIEVDGKKAWETRSVSGAGFFLNLKEGQTLEQAVAEASRPNPQFLRNVKLPAFLTKPRDPAWYGSSRLEAAGAR